MTVWNRLWLVLALAIFGASLSGCDRFKGADADVAPGTMATIEKTHTIIAGWAPYAPYAQLDPATRKPSGFYIDLFEEMASEAGYKVQWVETTWGSMIADLKSGRFEVMAAPVFRTIPRATQVAFTRPIDYFALSAVARSDDDRFKQLDDLSKPALQIAVTQGEVGYEYASRHLPNAKLKVFNTGDIALALTDVIQGRADVGVADAWTVKKFVQAHPGAVKDIFAGRGFNQVGAGWFVMRDDAEFLIFLNTSIDWLVSSGEVQRIARKYDLGSQPVDR